VDQTFYRLHEAIELIPARYATCKATAKFDAKTLRFSDWKQRAPFRTQPMLIGLLTICDRCHRWEPIEPCAPGEVQRQATKKGWREDESGNNLCKMCAGN
jgi:hypothetical protein